MVKTIRLTYSIFLFYGNHAMSFFRALFGRPKDCDPYHNFTVDGTHPALQRAQARQPSLKTSRSPKNSVRSIFQVIKDEFQLSIESLAEPNSNNPTLLSTQNPTLMPTSPIKTRLSSRIAELRREIAQKKR
jgi:hypothetical protein